MTRAMAVTVIAVAFGESIPSEVFHRRHFPGRQTVECLEQTLRACDFDGDIRRKRTNWMPQVFIQ